MRRYHALKLITPPRVNRQKYVARRCRGTPRHDRESPATVRKGKGPNVTLSSSIRRSDTVTLPKGERGRPTDRPGLAFDNPPVEWSRRPVWFAARDCDVAVTTSTGWAGAKFVELDIITCGYDGQRQNLVKR